MAATTATTGLAWDDLQRFPEDHVRREIIGGVLHVSPAPTCRHQRVVLLLGALLLEYDREHGGDVATGPNTWFTWFTDSDVVEPARPAHCGQRGARRRRRVRGR
ncbi:hypothetical protein BH23ACT8_BH23ACT8_22420 [soil metagenome]|jgi:Uma2 family endonuclease